MTALATTLSHHDRTPRRDRPAAARPGFTLVELLVVLIIVGMLVGLVTPAVMQALRKSRNAAIKAEIDMLHMAIMNYKNEYGSFPPCSSSLTLTSGPAGKHLARLFPRITSVGAELRNGVANPPPLDPSAALFVWLQGYTNDPTCPVTGTNTGGPRRKLFDFDRSRVSNLGSYAPPGKANSPYIYIDSSAYQSFQYSESAIHVPGSQFMPTSPPAPLAAGVPEAWRFTFNAPNQGFFNPDTFQILCAGSDEKFGTDDDLSNFWPGTRQEYLDSLKQQ